MSIGKGFSQSNREQGRLFIVAADRSTTRRVEGHGGDHGSGRRVLYRVGVPADHNVDRGGSNRRGYGFRLAVEGDPTATDRR